MIFSSDSIYSTYTLGLFMLPVLSFMAALMMINVLPKLGQLREWRWRKKSHSQTM